MPWGEFPMVYGWVHLAPADDDGDLTEDHDLWSRCPCRPEVVPVEGLNGWPSGFLVKHRTELEQHVTAR